MNNYSNKRVCVTILIKDGRAVKGCKFKNHSYIGDPLNIIRILNDFNVDEILVFDISNSQKIDHYNLEKLARESYCPISYGGNLNSFDKVKKIFDIGFDRVCFNKCFFNNVHLIKNVTSVYGKQSIIACANIKKNIFGNFKIVNNSKLFKFENLEQYLDLYSENAGEVILNFIDRDGTMSGLEISYANYISKNLKTPLMVMGGANSLKNIRSALKTNISSVAVGRMFFFYKKTENILLNYEK